MPDALILAAAVVACVAGMGWLALAMETHWAQIRTHAMAPAAVARLRVLGGLGLGGSLALCLWVDHASMAALVWVMVLAASALAVAFTLTWRPGWLRLLAWAGGAARA